jgi:hypothetical protein
MTISPLVSGLTPLGTDHTIQREFLYLSDRPRNWHPASGDYYDYPTVPSMSQRLLSPNMKTQAVNSNTRRFNNHRL